MTSSAKLISRMLLIGSFTHFVFPHNEKLFHNAAVDVSIFRYEKGISVPKVIVDKEGTISEMFCNSSNGIITFSAEDISSKMKFTDLFEVGVGHVSGKDEVFYQPFGNMQILVEEGKYESVIIVDKVPSGSEVIDNHLLSHKDTLIARGGCNFTEMNWFKWNRIANSERITANMRKPCIYVRCLCRNKRTAFIGEVGHFTGSLICLIPKNAKVDLQLITNYLNSDKFRSNYTYTGRFIIGQRQLAAAIIG